MTKSAPAASLPRNFLSGFRQSPAPFFGREIPQVACSRWSSRRQLGPGFEIRSAFQPIYSVAHSAAIGHEALLRGDGPRGPMGAGDIIASLSHQWSAAQIDEACARLHLSTFSRQAREGWLFLNVSPDVLSDRTTAQRMFGSWLRESGVGRGRVVVEIVEKEARSEQELACAIEGIRDAGCLVAIDDFGAGESNFQRIWRMRPDIVKLDRGILEEACQHAHVRQLVPGIVSLLHEAGCLVVLEGIETEEQAMVAMESDVDFVQGYLFSRPSEDAPDPADARAVFERLFVRFQRAVRGRRERDEGYFDLFTVPFQDCARSLEEGEPLSSAAQSLIRMPSTQRAYLLDSEGRQVGTNLESPFSASTETMEFSPFASSEGANWFRRPYFRRAVSRPGTLQISRPYLSVRDATRCVTLSMGLHIAGDLRVLCLDLDFDPDDDAPSSRSILLPTNHLAGDR